MGLAAGMTGLKTIAQSKKDAAAARQRDKDMMRKAKGETGKTLADLGRGVMAMDTRLKKGGRVSFKDVLKAKKRMGY